MQTGAVTAVGGVLYSWRIEPHWVEFTSRPLPISGLPASLQGANLVQLSDIHVGRFVDSAYLVDVMQRVSSLAPEIVVITGDFVTHTGSEVIDELGRVLEHVPHGSRRTVAVLGNHDYGTRWPRERIAKAVVQRAGDAGISLLRNSIVDVDGLRIVGLDDLWGRNFDPAPALQQLRPDDAALVLSHNPDAVDRHVWGEYSGWILSGHTHGGQVKPPFLPPPILPVRNHRYSAGEYDLGDGRFMYVNRGIGHLTRIRFNARPEVTVFRLQRA